MEYRLLGPLEVLDDRGRSIPITRTKPAIVMGLLLLHPNQVVSSDHLIEALWSRDMPARPEAALHVHVSRLRTLVGGEEVIVTRPPGYLVRVGPDELDVEVAERLLTEANRAREEAKSRLAAELLDEALALWRGEALVDFAFEEFAQEERRRIDGLRLAAMEALFECRLDLGRHLDVVAEVESLLAIDPLRERLWMTLMLALYRSGRQAEALRAYARAREVFGTELGIEPSPRMQELEERILLHDESLDQAGPSTAGPVGPLPAGVVSFLVTAVTAHGVADVSETVADVIEANGGLVFSIAGARSYSAFQVADDALAAAIAVQRRGRAEGFDVCSTLHSAEVEPVGGRFVGTPVAEAAAPQAVTGDGQIVATESFVLELAGSDEIEVRDEGDFHLPGGRDTRTLFRIVVDGVDDGTKPFRVDAVPRTNLVRPLTSIIGRERETAEIGELLATGRLVTVTGPGGVGKTRLAEAAASHELGLAGGVWWVGLADGRSPDLVRTAVAHALGIREPGTDILGEILQRVADSRMLLVLDGCDPVLEEMVAIVEPMLGSCPNLRILATSRERLGVSGERVYPLSALGLPEEGESTPGAVAEAGSVQLMVDRARALIPFFDITHDNASAIAAICRAVDGLPLGLELAAARLDVLGPDDLAQRLEHSLEILVGRGRIQRHRSLDEAVGWSVRLLDPDHVGALSDLTVFSGPFGIDAAEAVCETSAGALNVIAELAAKSLVAPSAGDGERRFTISRPIRDHVASSTPDDRRHAARRRHCSHYRAVASDVADSIRTPGAGDFLDRVELDHVELGSAIDWALEHDTESMSDMAASLWRYWFQRGYVNEGRRRLSQAMKVTNPAGASMVDLLHGAGVLAYLQGDVEEAVAHRARGLELARSRGDDLEVASALVFLGAVGAPHLDEASSAGMLAEGLEILRRAEDARGLASAFSVLGDAGEFHTRLAELSADGLAAFRRRGDDWGTATMLWYLATATGEDDPSTAASWFEEAGRLFVEVGDRRGTAQCLEGLGAALHGGGRDEDATLLLAVSERLRSEGEVRPTPMEQRTLDVLVRSLRARLGERFDVVWEEGGGMGAEEGLDRSLASPGWFSA